MVVEENEHKCVSLQFTDHTLNMVTPHTAETPDCGNCFCNYDEW